MVKISLGTEIYFSRDEKVKARVVDLHSSQSIEFNGRKISLSDSAQQVLGVHYAVSGTDYWMYDGETLDERRRRFEAGE